MEPPFLRFGELASAVKGLVGASVRSVIWGGIAVVAGLAALSFFLGALHTWLAEMYGSLRASLILGAALLIIAIIIAAVRIIQQRQAQRRFKRQQQMFSVQPAMLAASMMGRAIGLKRTAILMGVALASGWLVARPWRRRRDDD